MDKNKYFEKLVAEAHEKGVFTGTWLYAENGEAVSKGAVGRRDPEDRLPILESSVFDLASVSKQFTACAIMLLRRRGLLDLEDEITDFFPEIPYKGVTIRHLLNHTGGLPDYMDWVEKTAKAENTVPGNAVIVRFLCECGEAPVFAPGEKYEYSNTGYCLLAQIVEEVSGVPFDDFLLRNVFEPAGMRSTRVIHRRMNGLTAEDLAYGMVLKDGKYILPDDAADLSSCVVPLDGMSGDGLVHSNIFDLLTWDRALREEKVLTAEEQEMMYTPGRLNDGSIAGEKGGHEQYGFGWEIINDPELGLVVCHSGGWPGYSIWYERFIDADRVLITLCCRSAADERGYDSFLKGMRDAARGKEPEPVRLLEDIAVGDPDRSGWAALCGTYEWRTYVIEISMRDGDLYARFTSDDGNSDEERMYPLGEKTFGIKEESGDISFGEGSLSFYGTEGRKL